MFFFVTLQEFSAFLCIKAVWGIEENLGYELATVLNSAFCYKLHQRTPDVEPATIYDSSSGAKVIILSERTKSIQLFFLLSLLNTFELIAASFAALAKKVRIRLRPFTDFYADYSYVSFYFTTFAHIIHNR